MKSLWDSFEVDITDLPGGRWSIAIIEYGQPRCELKTGSWIQIWKALALEAERRGDEPEPITANSEESALNQTTERSERSHDVDKCGK